jgi:hypothetical protein
MDLRGEWRNQYGSVLTIDEDVGGRLCGRFRTALSDSAFFGRETPVLGVRCGEVVSVATAVGGEGEAAVCAFTGRLEQGRLETVWHVVTTARPWPHAVATNADTFTRAS